MRFDIYGELINNLGRTKYKYSTKSIVRFVLYVRFSEVVF